MKDYKDIVPKSMKVAESVAYCLPALSDSDKLELASKLIVSVKGTFQTENNRTTMTLTEAKNYLRSRRLVSHNVPADFNGMRDEVNEKYL